MKRAIDILAKYQKHLLGLAIFLSLFAVSIKSRKGETNLFLKNYPLLMFLLVAFSIILILIYIQIDKQKITNLSNHIKLQSTDNNKFDSLVSELTSRQKEVYDLIVSGKTNKEIMSELFIEQSTLKTHINQIYKKLNIKSRKELKPS